MSISTSSSAALLTTQGVKNLSQVNVSSSDALKLTVASIKADANNGSLMNSATQALQSLGLSIGSGSANNNSSSSTVSSTSPLDAKKVLLVFLQDLYKTLTQTNAPTQNTSTSHANEQTSPAIAYSSNAVATMQNLITALDNNSSQHASLQSKFANVVEVLSGVSSTTSRNVADPNVASSLHLQDFLKQLSAINGNNSLPNGVGSLFDATA